MDEVGIEIYTDTTCREVTSSGVVCTKDGGDLVLEGETIAAALGLKPTLLSSKSSEASRRSLLPSATVYVRTPSLSRYIRGIMPLSISTEDKKIRNSGKFDLRYTHI